MEHGHVVQNNVLFDKKADILYLKVLKAFCLNFGWMERTILLLMLIFQLSEYVCVQGGTVSTSESGSTSVAF